MKCISLFKILQEAYDVVVSVPRRANDLMHLGNFENYKVNSFFSLLLVLKLFLNCLQVLAVDQ